ncbi:MAG: DMT family transporter [Gammaproteobacteria bacterium]|nr:DMT family transporter [Gammaproteobacteria bacterium]
MKARGASGADAKAGHEWSGMLIGVAVATSFAANSTLARLAYDAGSNALSVLTVRTGVALLALFVLVLARRVPLAMAPRRRLGALLLGILLGVYSYGLLGGIEHMPVGLVVITFYTYPFLVALGSWLLGRERITFATVVALVVAFIGLTLALDFTRAEVNTIGVSMALGAAFVFALVLLSSDRVRGDGDSRPVTLHMLLAAFVGYLAACAISGHFALPREPYGWIGFVGTPVFYSFSIITLFVVITMIGPVRAALTLNVEPVASVILGYVVLDQHLGPVSILGIAMVVGAVVSMRLASLHARGAGGGRALALAMILTGSLLILGSLALYVLR